MAAATTTEKPTTPSATQPTASQTTNTQVEDPEVLFECVNTDRGDPPGIRVAAGQYSLDRLRARKTYADTVRRQNPEGLPGLWRFANCYAYVLCKAAVARSKLEATLNQRHVTSRHDLQVWLLDLSHVQRPHPCDAPYSSEGRRYLMSAVALLRYTTHLRYQRYLGRHLRSFSSGIDAMSRAFWINTYKKWIEENTYLEDLPEDSKSDGVFHIDGVYLVGLLPALNRLLRLRPGTMEDAMKVLHKSIKDPHLFRFWTGSPDGTVRLYHIEKLVYQGRYEDLAHHLYRDLVTLGSLLCFDQDDEDIVHLQAIVSGFIQLFFNIECSVGQQDCNPREWQPSSMFDFQMFCLHNGDRKLTAQVRWTVQIRAEEAEKKFRAAWNALLRDRGENVKGVQELLAMYLGTLDVEYAGADGEVI